MIIGGGVAALSAANALRERGFPGRVHVLCAEDTSPYERPALSKAYLLDHDDSENPVTLDEAQVALGRGIDLELAVTVVGVDTAGKTVITNDNRCIAYTRLLLATGARCRRLGLPGEQLPGVHYLREEADARELRPELAPGARIAIVGGGVIGLEIAAAATERGCAATVLEASDRVMGRVVPRRIADELASMHRARGVAVLTGVSPVAFTGANGRVVAVELADGGAVPCDAVVVGVGSAPRTELALAAGLAVDDGILVDEYFRTSAPNVFAAGDAARIRRTDLPQPLRTESWEPAREQGRLAASAILGDGHPYRRAPWMWSDQYDAVLQATGFGFADAELITRGGMTDRTGLVCFAVRDQHLTGVYGLSRGPGVGKAILLGQKLIERACSIDPQELRDGRGDLKSLLRGLARRMRERAAA